jgi:hypothetical protein
MHHSQLPKDVESLKRDQYLCCSRLKIAQPRSFRSHYENVSHEIARDHIEYSTSQSGRRDSTDRVDTSRESSMYPNVSSQENEKKARIYNQK